MCTEHITKHRLFPKDKTEFYKVRYIFLKTKKTPSLTLRGADCMANWLLVFFTVTPTIFIVVV